MLDELGLYREQAGRILEHPHKVQGDSKQSISQWRARERRVISQVWGLERIRMGGGEENSVKLLRVRMSGRQGLGPTSLAPAVGGCFQGTTVLEDQRKEKARPKYNNNSTGLDCSCFQAHWPLLPCYHPTNLSIVCCLYFSSVRPSVANSQKFCLRSYMQM